MAARFAGSMTLDDTHAAVAALRLLLPEAHCIGGAFGAALPHPGSLQRENRAVSLSEARSRASDLCVEGLLRAGGLPSNCAVPRAAGGNRIWPEGFVGSLTHKGAVVLGAIASKTRLRALGIDLERYDAPGMVAIRNVIAPEALPSGVDQSLGTDIVFAAKEAVFKAQYPLTHERLEFADVRLVWSGGGGQAAPHLARCPTFPDFAIRVACVGVWLLAAAFWVNES